jgi:hypothetical protein
MFSASLNQPYLFGFFSANHMLLALGFFLCANIMLPALGFSLPYGQAC